MNKRNVAIALIAAICLTGCILYLDYYFHFHDRFLPGTRINNNTVSGMDLDSAIADLEGEYSLTVHFREGKTEKVRGGDIDFRLNMKDTLQELLERQGFLAYLKSFVTSFRYNVPTSAAYDREKLAGIALAWPEMDESAMVKPVDAHIVYKDGDFSIIPETPGNTIRIQKALQELNRAVSTGAKTWEPERIAGVYRNAQVKKDDPTLNADLETMKNMAWNTVTYKLPTGQQVLDPNTTMDWLKRGKDGKLEKKKNHWNKKIREYVVALAGKVDTVDKKHTFKTHSGKVIKLKSQGYYGWRIDQEAEAKQLAKDLAAASPVSRKPAYIQREAANYSDNYGYGDSYVEINLSKQHLWMYKKGKVVLESDVVSGTAGAHATPDGAYFILDKARNVTLRGPQVKTKPKKDKDGKVITPAKKEYEWESPVSYWMPLTYEGVGMHDASWRGAFGGGIWQYNGSHGCINLPVSFAPKLFSHVKVGMPVAVYY